MARASRARRTDDTGAAAVELALVSIVLFPLLFGMIQFGLLFNDHLQVRSAARAGARLAVVQGTVPGCASSTGYYAKVACYTAGQSSPTSGTVQVRVSASSWVRGAPVKVCVVGKSGGPSLLPMPNGGYVRAVTQMSIEQAETAPTGSSPGFHGGATDPSGGSWSWC